jgi:hypothetical protein
MAHAGARLGSIGLLVRVFVAVALLRLQKSGVEDVSLPSEKTLMSGVIVAWSMQTLHLTAPSSLHHSCTSISLHRLLYGKLPRLLTELSLRISVCLGPEAHSSLSRYNPHSTAPIAQRAVRVKSVWRIKPHPTPALLLLSRLVFALSVDLRTTP